MASLADRQCVPCRGDVPPLGATEIAPLLAQLDGWQVVANHHLEKTYRLPNFARALELVNRIGAIAEEFNHHPDIAFGWGWARITIWTHAIDGLAEADFVLAARCDRATDAMSP